MRPFAEVDEFFCFACQDVVAEAIAIAIAGGLAVKSRALHDDLSFLRTLAICREQRAGEEAV